MALVISTSASFCLSLSVARSVVMSHSSHACPLDHQASKCATTCAKYSGVQKSTSVQVDSKCLKFYEWKRTPYLLLSGQPFLCGKKKNQNFRGEILFAGLFETLPGRVQCEMLLKVTEQCFNTLERSEMLLLLLRRFPETVVQHGVGLIPCFPLRKDSSCLSLDSLAFITHLQMSSYQPKVIVPKILTVLFSRKLPVSIVFDNVFEFKGSPPS